MGDSGDRVMGGKDAMMGAMMGPMVSLLASLCSRPDGQPQVDKQGLRSLPS